MQASQLAAPITLKELKNLDSMPNESKPLSQLWHLSVLTDFRSIFFFMKTKKLKLFNFLKRVSILKNSPVTHHYLSWTMILNLMQKHFLENSIPA